VNPDQAVLLGVAACAGAVLVLSWLLLAPWQTQLAMDRRRPPTAPVPNPLARAATALSALIDKTLRRRTDVGVHTAVLERAGVKMSLQDLVLLTIAGALAVAALGLVLVGPGRAFLFALLVPIGVRVGLNVLASRRRAAFADQLDDSLQLIASSLRAGHSLLQSLASVAREAEDPTKEEFSRILNESRVGRELGVALDETAARMGSQDFVWVTEAIAINREVGGNLAEVLDGVGHTIRERNQIRRQVKSLAAEGKLSAYILIALPFGIGGFLAFSSPEYIGKFVESLLGYAMLGACAVLLLIGSFWLSKVVSIKF
jgi:tight adherence protein B